MENPAVDESGPTAQGRELMALAPALACPVCKRPLAGQDTETGTQMRCLAGHTFTRTSLLGRLDEAAEDALWTALMTLNDSVQLARELARELYQQNHRSAARQLEMGIREQQRRVSILQDVLLGSTTFPLANQRAASANGPRTKRPRPIARATSERPAAERKTSPRQRKTTTGKPRHETRRETRRETGPTQRTERQTPNSRPTGRKRPRPQ